LQESISTCRFSKQAFFVKKCIKPSLNTTIINSIDGIKSNNELLGDRMESHEKNKVQLRIDKELLKKLIIEVIKILICSNLKDVSALSIY